ncbi:uncharacterized protein [Coffea arabica]|uniref:Uncharacterized protein isoform X1 n=1 Tax=Coffea arabica TaxID=13443 RepID=A0A6P6UWQ2_COFAR|nr:uncharacterized protein LOC113715071 isoform X1 [Coffea arabica]
MKDEEAQTTTTSAAASTTTNAAVNKKEGSSEVGFLGRSRYKFWALAAILLLAFWSMFTGSVTLKWSSVHLNHVSDDLFGSPLHHDLDILEVEEREKMVRRLWDVYTQSKTVKLPIFWREAFEAAYEDLISEVPRVRHAAISEIAKMSLVRSTLIHQLEPSSHNSIERASTESKLATQPGGEKVSTDRA